jgi:hypothetical protein
LFNWLDTRTSEHLLISGADLLAAGVAEGPAIGRALAATLDQALDGRLQDHDGQLRYALGHARLDRSEHVAD